MSAYIPCRCHLIPLSHKFKSVLACVFYKKKKKIFFFFCEGFYVFTTPLNIILKKLIKAFMAVIKGISNRSNDFCLEYVIKTKFFLIYSLKTNFPKNVLIVGYKLNEVEPVKLSWVFFLSVYGWRLYCV